MLLEGAGHEVVIAHDGVEAVEVAERIQPEVVLLDIGLPRLGGHAAAARIRSNEQVAAAADRGHDRVG